MTIYINLYLFFCKYLNPKPMKRIYSVLLILLSISILPVSADYYYDWCELTTYTCTKGSSTYLCTYQWEDTGSILQLVFCLDASHRREINGTIIPTDGTYAVQLVNSGQIPKSTGESTK